MLLSRAAPAEAPASGGQESSTPTTAKRIVFTGPQQVTLAEFPIPTLAEDKILIKTVCSLMSTGTENIVFNRSFSPGTHWDDWVKYPFQPGYASAGEVVWIGNRVTGVQIGDRLIHREGHCSHAVVAPDKTVLVPKTLPLDRAVWFALAKIAFHGALAAEYRLGDSVLIIGAGPIGQMSLRWARAAGASSILVADLAEARLHLAKNGGATAVIPLPIHTAREAILENNHGRLPRVVIDSTGNAAVFSEALKLTADRGTVVLLGDTGHPGEQHLSRELITRGLRVVGAHDNHTTPEWNLTTITNLFFTFAAQGRFALDELNTHTFPPDNCRAAYQTANTERSKTMGILFDWSAPNN